MDEAVVRRYLLGDADEGERATIEEEYFRNAESADRVAEIEEDLIDDYLAARLGPREREKFDRVYLATRAHRVRLEIIRRLTRPAASRRAIARGWLALAAAAIVAIAIGALWFVASSGTPRIESSRQAVPAASSQPAEPEASAARIPPAVFAITLSPLNVRGAGDVPTNRVPTGTATIRLQLEGDAGGSHLQDARVAIEDLDGRAVWTGPAVAGDAAGIIAGVDVPSADLQPGDYIVRVSGNGAGSSSREQRRYFLRIRR